MVSFEDTIESLIDQLTPIDSILKLNLNLHKHSNTLIWAYYLMGLSECKVLNEKSNCIQEIETITTNREIMTKSLKSVDRNYNFKNKNIE